MCTGGWREVETGRPYPAAWGNMPKAVVAPNTTGSLLLLGVAGFSADRSFAA